jgi:Protein of unknown function (DUF2846)
MDRHLLPRAGHNFDAAARRSTNAEVTANRLQEAMRQVLTILLAVLVIGCDTAPQQRSTTFPAQAPGKARFYFYREMSPYMGLEWTEVSLNEVAMGSVAPGAVIYRDVAPGLYEVEVRSDRLYPNQFKMVAVEAGTSTYVRVDSQPFWGQSGVAWWGNTFVVAIVDPVIARQQIEGLRQSDG